MSTTDSIDTLQDLLQRRHSCRGFLPERVPRETILRMLAAAQRTGSWCNAQSWQAHIVSGTRLDALRGALLARAQAGTPAVPELDWPVYQGIYQERRRECGWDLYRAVGIGKGDREASARQSHENFRCFGAPHLAIVTSAVQLGTHGVMDCGAWVSNFMLAATALGVASIAQAAIASWPDVLRQHVEIAQDRRIVCGVSFGFEDIGHPANRFRTTRAALDEAAFWVE
jgi:nitroreductase